jgi:hypothetical protein
VREPRDEQSPAEMQFTGKNKKALIGSYCVVHENLHDLAQDWERKEIITNPVVLYVRSIVACLGSSFRVEERDLPGS